MTKTKLKSLLHQYFNDTISQADCLELLAYLHDADQEEVSELIDEELGTLDSGPQFRGQQSADVFNRIISDSRFTVNEAPVEYSESFSLKFYQRRWVQIAAMLLILCTVSLYATKKAKAPKDATSTVAHKPILPGDNRATLTLASGKVILLDSAANGLLDLSAVAVVQKTEKGKVSYTNVVGAAKSDITSYNTLTTPKGGEYQLTLPDGTKVWLNAASSIKFPVAFNNNQRRVTLTGEAYFEVAKDKKKPFYVNANNSEVRVLGTHFNISAYSDDDNITTTLLEGSVQIAKNNNHSLLKPGQQAVMNKKLDGIAISAAQGMDAIAWTKGYFVFNDDNVNSIMKKISRWYDVDVVYQGTNAAQKFGGTFYRHKSITELTHYLEKIGNIHFKTEGRRIVVMD